MTSRVLIVDDNPSHRLLTRRAASRALPHLRFIEAQSLIEAQRLQDTHYELVLLDLNLGDGDGLDFLRGYRRLFSLEHAPVVIVSTSDLEHELNAAYREGANACIRKSTEPAEFARMVRDAAAFFLRPAARERT